MGMRMTIVDGAVPKMSYRKTVYTVEETAQAFSLCHAALTSLGRKPALRRSTDGTSKADTSNAAGAASPYAAVKKDGLTL